MSSQASGKGSRKGSEIPGGWFKGEQVACAFKSERAGSAEDTGSGPSHVRAPASSAPRQPPGLPHVPQAPPPRA